MQERDIKGFESLLMVENDGLEQPDGIGHSITSLEGFLAGIPRQARFVLPRQNFVEAPDGNIRDGNRMVL